MWQECRECGQSARTCQSLELLRDGKDIVNLSVSRTQPSTSKRVLHSQILCALNRGGIPWNAGGKQSKMIRRKGLYGMSQPAPVLKETHLDQNTTVKKPHKERVAGVTAVTRLSFAVLCDRHRLPVRARGASSNAGAWHVCAIWRNRHRLPTSIGDTGGNAGAWHTFAIWRDRDRLPASISVHS